MSLDAGYNLYFASDRDGVQRVYRSQWLEGGHQPPELVPFDVNLQEGAGNPLVVRDGRMLIFVSDREGGYGGADLYATCRLAVGWSAAVNLGPRVNSAQADFAPALAADGEYLVFTSERPGVVPAVAADARPPGDIYYMRLANADVACRESTE